MSDAVCAAGGRGPSICSRAAFKRKALGSGPNRPYRFRMNVGESTKDWTPIAIALGTRVRQERERLGLSKESLAERSGLASRYLWRVEAGRQNLQLLTISKIAAGLGLSLSELMAGVEQLMAEPVIVPPPKPRGAAANRARR